jgi:hypothetical protein
MTAHRLTVVVLIAATMSGCTTVGRWLPNRPTAAVGAPAANTTETGHDLLDDLARLQVDSASTQAELVAGAKGTAEMTPTVGNRLRYAAYLAIPRQPSADPVAARRQLSELLAQPELLRPADRILAALLLNDVEERLVLQAETDRLRQDLSFHEKDHPATPPPKRSTAEAEEIARLKRALDEAQRKLDAVTEVEKSMLGRRSPAKQ